MKSVAAAFISLVAILPSFCPAANLGGSVISVLAPGYLTVTAVNHLAIARANQTIELTISNFPFLNQLDPAALNVADSHGMEILCQAVDTDYDELHQPDTLIFQADFAPSETKTFIISAGQKQEYAKAQFKAYGRFVRERFDDFAWENDRIAHRTYGKALETWKGEPLTSSAIDIWSKRTSRLVINDWYLLDNYHADGGEGLDDYSAGATCGDGADGLWREREKEISLPRNFVDSRVLANGPIRVMLELVYGEYDDGATRLAEVRRISLDAGSQLDHYQISYKVASSAGVGPAPAIGLKKVAREQLELNAANGWLSSWEPMEKNLGMQGVALVFNSKDFVKQTNDPRNNLVILKWPDSRPLDYWAGFAWDRAGQITSAETWKKYVDEFAQATSSPIEIKAK